MFADPKQTAARKLRRHMKAGVSIVVAVVAGAWLACRPTTTQPGPSPQGPDARTGPERSAGSAPPPPPEGDANERADAAETNALDVTTDSGDASADRAIVQRRHAPRAPSVDRHEHRNGMPVRDNLLE
ncbi:MAG: hypothetical protein U0269_29525 [Polyangiales bacterium]